MLNNLYAWLLPIEGLRIDIDVTGKIWAWGMKGAAGMWFEPYRAVETVVMDWATN